MQKYAELMLYMGICNNNGLSEGLFYKDKRDEYSKKRYNDAMQLVVEKLDLVAEGRLAIEYGCFKVVKNEIEAVKLIEYTKKHFHETIAVIELIDSMHGLLRFFRKIRFDGAIESDRQKLIDIINQSGMGPITDPQNYGVDYCWKRALEFH